MLIYKCNSCEYTTKVKQNMTKHMNKKNPCKTKIVYGSELIELKELKEQNNNKTDNNEILENNEMIISVDKVIQFLKQFS